jgi:hypothetical protein
MKKRLYRIIPKDRMSCSGRWIVDEFGLNYLKNHYTYYDSHNETINRWVEFRVEVVDTINFDFGGMIDANEPGVMFRWRGIVCGLPLTHIFILKEALRDSRCMRPSGGWCVRIWMWKWYISDATRFELLKIVNRLCIKKEKIAKEYNEKFINKMKDLRNKGVIE